MAPATCSACSGLSIEALRRTDHNKTYSPHANVGELRACAESLSQHCGVCRLLWRTMDDLTQLDVSKPAIRSHPGEIYGLYGQFYDDFDYQFGAPYNSAGMPSYESCIKIEARFLTYNFGLDRIGIRVFALEDTPAAHHFSERCTYADKTTGLSMKLGQKWLRICREHHEECRFIASDMPTRVIALGHAGGKTQLLVTNGQREPYVALSYCWGRGAIESLMLHDENVALMQQEIDETRLVKTYREAFQAARDLGFWYIWVDALCIIQGNKEDWEHESQKMGEVYGNAALTIIAARSGDSKNGFLQNNYRPAVDPCPIPYGRQGQNGSQIHGLFVGLDRSEFKTTMAADPVQSRGWCLQEAELSRRSLVFGADGVSWQCKKTDYFEDEVWKFVHKRDVEWKGEFEPGPDNTRRNVNRLEMLNHWYAEILPGYSARMLTNRGDIFAAISSLAKMAKQTIGGRYLAGLWESDLPRGLLWKPRYQTRWMVDISKRETSLIALQRPANPQAPSWSWAAVQGPIQHGWDHKKKWRSYPVDSRPEEFLVRPSNSEYIRWSSQGDYDAHVLYMPKCELQVYGRLRRLRCANTPSARLVDWYAEQGWYGNQRPDDLPPKARGTILFKSAEERLEDIPFLEKHGPFDRVVAYGIFDIAEERIEEFWALPLTKDLGLILDQNGDGSFHRLGIFHLSNYRWFAVGQEQLVRLV